MKRFTINGSIMELADIVEQDVVIITGTLDSPGVMLDRTKGTMVFTGRSLPENPRAFYQPIKHWLTLYAENPLPETLVTFNLDYFNTASSKVIMDIIEMLKETEKSGTHLRIQWHYMLEDEEMREAGQEFADVTEMKFEFISYS